MPLRTLFTVPSKGPNSRVRAAWNASGTFLCVVGSNGLATVYDRTGTQTAQAQLDTRAQCTRLDWDRDGEACVIVQAGVDRVAVLEVAPAQSVLYVDTGLKEVTFAAWSLTGPQLALGSASGGLVLYRRDTRKKLPIAGKHTGAITCGAWSLDGRLALGGADRWVTVSTPEGDELDRVECRTAPAGLQWGGAAGAEGLAGAGGAAGEAAAAALAAQATLREPMLSVNMGGRGVLLYTPGAAPAIQAAFPPTELQFQQRYGAITAYKWFTGGYMALGFSEGFLVVISTHASELGEELFSSGALLKGMPVEDVAVNPAGATRIACAGGPNVRCVDTAAWAEVGGESASVEAGACIETLAWSRDGVILTAVARSGSITAFLSAAPPLCGASTTLCVHMTGLKELAVCGIGGVAAAAEAAALEASEAKAAGAGAAGAGAAGASPHITAVLPTLPGQLFIPLVEEPSVLGVGPSHVAVGLHNRVWLYAVSPSQGAYILTGERTFPDAVHAITLTASHVIAHCAGKLFVQGLEEGGAGTSSTSSTTTSASQPAAGAILPLSDSQHAGARITAVGVGGPLLFYGTDGGQVHAYSLQHGVMLAHTLSLGEGVGIRALGVNGLGTRAVVCDTLGRAFLFNPVAGQTLEVPLPPCGAGAAGAAVAAHWDALDKGVFAITVGGAGGAGTRARAGGEKRAGAGAGSAASTATGSSAPGSSSSSAPGSSSSSSSPTSPSPSERLIFSFLHTPITVSGPTIALLGRASLAPDGSLANECDLPPQHTPPASLPLALVGGQLLCHASAGGGALITCVLPTYTPLLGSSAMGKGQRINSSRARDMFSASLLLSRGAAAWAAARAAAAAGQGHADAMLRAVAAKAMETLDPAGARRAYRALREPGLALSLEACELGGEDRAHVTGDMCVLFGDFGAAQAAFCASARPRSALELRLDLRDWEAAQALAGALEPAAAPAVALERALGEEMGGRTDAALGIFKDTLARAEAALAEAEAECTATAGAAGSSSNSSGSSGSSGSGSSGGGGGSGAPLQGWYADTGMRVAAHAEASARAAASRTLRAAATAGIARCTLRSGDVRAGAALALASGDLALARECGALAESVGALGEAAALYRAAGAMDKAAELFLRLGSARAAEPLLPHVSSLRLQCAYGAALEKEGEYGAAAAAYERGRDTAALVRLMVQKLGQAGRAGELVRAVGCKEGAVLLASHATERKDFRGAIEFLLLAHREEAAFALAKEYGEMNVYVGVLLVVAGAGGGAAGTPAPASAALAAPSPSPAISTEQLSLLPRAECLRVGAYYEQRGGGDATLRAAQFFSAAGEHGRALNLLLAAAAVPAPPPATTPAPSGTPSPPPPPPTTAMLIEEAVRLCGRAASPPCTARLLSFLRGEGEGNGIPKDARYIFSLHMALGAYPAAAAEALAIARCEQESPSGSFKTAHGILLDAYSALTSAGAAIPLELWRTLTLLHSYLLVKKLIGVGEHEGAARMLARVVKSISRFPAHATPILTSAVVQCQRGGLRATAYELACTLQLPAHRGGVKEEFRKKIESMVRKPTGEEDAPHPPTPCPFCDAPVPSYNMACAACQSTLPFCIVTGRHMTREDCSACPSCKFPALFSPLSAQAAGGGYACPMCSSPVTPASVALIRDPVVFLRSVVGGAGAGAARAGEGGEAGSAGEAGAAE